MKMRILKKDGSIVDKTNALGRTPHQKNLDFLNNNPTLKSSILFEVLNHIDKFILDIKGTNDGYMHSADIAYTVCKDLGLLMHSNNYGLVGSTLFEEIESYDCTKFGLSNSLVIVASKGEGQTHFDYFPDKNTISLTTS